MRSENVFIRSACVWEGGKKWKAKRKQFRWKNFFYLLFLCRQQEYENWELIQFHATIVFVVLTFLSEKKRKKFIFILLSSFYFCELMAGINILLVLS